MSESEDSPSYTVDLNGKRYELNESARRAIQERAEREFEPNPQFSCWWKNANPADYDDDEWDEIVHESNDPILVIETTGVMVPWENLDTLEVEMQDVGQTDDTDAHDAGNGMQALPPDAADPEEGGFEEDRTHFTVTPEEFQESPAPDGEEADSIPPKPVEFDEPEMVLWLPSHPDLEHTWATGEAVTTVSSWVEWNVQQYANQPRPVTGKRNSHNHWESILSLHDCEVIATHETNQDIPSPDSGDTERKKEDIGGKYGGTNWRV